MFITVVEAFGQKQLLLFINNLPGGSVAESTMPFTRPFPWQRLSIMLCKLINDATQ